MSDIRVNFGCGPDVRPGWWNVDLDDYPGLDHHGDLLDGLPLDDGSARLVVANHSLQMFPWTDLPDALTELGRVLAPGGLLRVLVPDVFTARGAYAAYRAADDGWFPVARDVEREPGGKLAAYGLWYSTARSQFTPAWLSAMFLRAGLLPAVACAGVTFSAHPDAVELDSRPRESIVVEGTPR